MPNPMTSPGQWSTNTPEPDYSAQLIQFVRPQAQPQQPQQRPQRPVPGALPPFVPPAPPPSMGHFGSAAGRLTNMVPLAQGIMDMLGGLPQAQPQPPPQMAAPTNPFPGGSRSAIY